jgi:hypothetical protein
MSIEELAYCKGDLADWRLPLQRTHHDIFATALSFALSLRDLDSFQLKRIRVSQTALRAGGSWLADRRTIM